MKSLSLKKIIFFLVIFAATFSVCPAQDAANQNAENQNNYERLPFMQNENNSGAANSEPGSGGLIVRTLGAMVLIVGVIFFGAWGLKKLGFGNLKTDSAEDVPDLAILSSVSLGGGRTISTVRFGEKILLVGSTAQSFTLLADGDTDNEIASLNQPRSVAQMLAEENDSFSAALEKAEFDFADWSEKGERA